MGFKLVNAKIYARKPPRREELLHLLDAFERIEKPFVMHCKSGADRAGFAAALWMHIHEGQSIAEAQKQLAPKYLHLAWTKTGIVDHILDVYAAERANSGIDFRAWVETHYDQATLRASFAATPIKQRMKWLK